MNSKKVKGRGKRFIAGFLALLMAVTLLPVNTLSVAYAEELDAVETVVADKEADSVVTVDEETDAADSDAVIDEDVTQVNEEEALEAVNLEGDLVSSEENLTLAEVDTAEAPLYDGEGDDAGTELSTSLLDLGTYANSSVTETISNIGNSIYTYIPPSGGSKIVSDTQTIDGASLTGYIETNKNATKTSDTITFTAEKSGTLTAYLKSGGDKTHDFLLDTDNGNADPSTFTIPKSSEGGKAFTFSISAGTYYLCNKGTGKARVYGLSLKYSDDEEPDDPTPASSAFAKAPYFESTGVVDTPYVGDTLTLKYEKAASETRVDSVKWYSVKNETDTELTDNITTDEDGNSCYEIQAADKDSSIKAVVTLTDSANAENTISESCETGVVAEWSIDFKTVPTLKIKGESGEADVPVTTETVVYPGDILTVDYELNVKEGQDEAAIVEWEVVGGNTGAEETTPDPAALTTEDGVSTDGKSYTVQKTDAGKTVKVTVTPSYTTTDGNDSAEDNKNEDAKESVEKLITEKKVGFTNDGVPALSISGDGTPNLAYPKPGNILTVSYTLDKEGDDASTIQWYKTNDSGTTEITDDTNDGDDQSNNGGAGDGSDDASQDVETDGNNTVANKTLTITDALIGYTIKAKVTPNTDDENSVEGDAVETVSTGAVQDSNFTPSYNLELIASDIPVGTYTNTITKTGFTIKAGEDEGTGEEKVSKSVTVDANSKTIDNVAYKARLKMGGVGTKDYRSIRFDTEAEATLKIVCASSSDANPSKLGIGTITTDADSQTETLTDFTGEYKLSNATTKTSYAAGGIEINNNVGAYSDKTHIVEATLAADTTYCLYTTEGSGINFYAVYVNYTNGKTAEYFTLTLDANEGNAVASQRALSGECYLEPSAARIGYALNGWYTSKESADAATAADKYDFSTPVTGNLKLYAGWTEAPAQGNQYEIDMSELPAGTYTKEFTWKSFTFKAASGKDLTLEANEAKDVEAPDGTKHDYTQRLKLNGTGDTSDRNISFSIDKEANLSLVVVSGSDEERTLVVTNNNGKSYNITAPKSSEGAAMLSPNEKLAAGKWYIYSSNKGINIYYINVDLGENGGEEGDPLAFTKAPQLSIAKGTSNTEESKLSVSTPHAGEVLTVDYTLDLAAGATDASTITWYRTKAGAADVQIKTANITGNADNDAAAKSYTVSSTDEGYKIKVSVTPKDSAGNAGTLASAETGTVRAEGDDSTDEDGLQIRFKDGDVYTYTGAAIKPAIVVTNNGKTLVEGTDYTVRYTNNIKASETKNDDGELVAINTNEKKFPTVTVTGKGNLGGKTFAYFKINPKDLEDKDAAGAANAAEVAANGVKANDVVVLPNKKAAPVLLYGGVKLAARDYEVTKVTGSTDDNIAKPANAKWAEGASGTITFKAKEKGNFTGEVTINVIVATAAQQKAAKMKAVFKDGNAAKTQYYNAESITPEIIVSNSDNANPKSSAETDADKKLVSGEDFVISYPADTTNVGTKKVMITGTSVNCIGTVTLTYSIKPAKKTDASLEAVLTPANTDGYDYVSTGVTVGDDLTVSYKYGEKVVTPLVEGIDYKVTYTNNKKASTASASAAYVVTGLGNYKGLKTDKQYFTIKGLVLSNENKSETSGEGIQLIVADKIYNKKAVYKSVPSLIVNGELVKTSEYTVKYSLDETAEKTWSTNPGKIELGENETSKTVYVKVEPKPNKVNYIAEDGKELTASYNVVRTTKKDLSTARITLQDENGRAAKVAYTGKEVTPYKALIKIKGLDNDITIILDGEGADYEAQGFKVTYANNVLKGKATVVIEATDDNTNIVGSKSATFNIVQKNLLTGLKPDEGFKEYVANVFKSLFDN